MNNVGVLLVILIAVNMIQPTGYVYNVLQDFLRIQIIIIDALRLISIVKTIVDNQGGVQNAFQDILWSTLNSYSKIINK